MVILLYMYAVLRGSPLCTPAVCLPARPPACLPAACCLPACADDFEAVRAIAMEVGNDVHDDGYVPVICGLSRTRFADLERAWEAVRHAKRPRVHTFIATSEIHMQYKLRMTRDQVRQMPADMPADSAAPLIDMLLCELGAGRRHHKGACGDSYGAGLGFVGPADR